MLRSTWMLITIERLLLASRLPVVWSLAIGPTCAHPLDRHPPADIVRDEQSLQHAAVARHFGRWDLERHGAKAAAGAARNAESAGALRQRAEPTALAVKDLDLPDMAVAIRIELDLWLAGACRRGHAA
jgi:hypothetical protein